MCYEHGCADTFGPFPFFYFFVKGYISCSFLFNYLKNYHTISTVVVIFYEPTIRVKGFYFFNTPCNTCYFLCLLFLCNTKFSEHKLVFYCDFDLPMMIGAGVFSDHTEKHLLMWICSFYYFKQFFSLLLTCSFDTV